MKLERLACLVAFPLSLLLPFVAFLKHHDYGLLTPEALLSACLLTVVGGSVGVLAAAVPLAMRVLLLATALAVFVDIQFPWVREPPGLWIAAAAALPVLWLARQQLARVLAFLFGVMLLTTLPLPGGDGRSHEWRADAPPAARSDLPPLIHIVLDEQLGIEGIPLEFDPEGDVAAQMKQTYLEHRFEVFGRSFTQYYDTAKSLAQIMTLTQAQEDRVPTESSLEKNAYFGLLGSRGYRIHVYQTDYLDFCADEAAPIDSCFTYALESAGAFEAADLTVASKVEGMLGMFVRLSPRLTRVQGSYGVAERWLGEHGVDLPSWPDGVGRVSALTALGVFDRIQQALVAAKPGEAHVVHWMLPHYPFALDAQCNVRPSPREWLTGNGPSVFPRRNNEATRSERYPLYLEQVACTHRLLGRLFERLEAAGKLNGAIVIVHGDHGSRLDTGPPSEALEGELSRRDYVDAFSSLFAWHPPGGRARYDERMLPVAALLRTAARAGSVPPGTRWAEPRQVYLQPNGGVPGPRTRWIPSRMPRF